MKVKDLIVELGKYDDEAIVAVSQDEEGNGFGTVNKKSIGVENGIVIIFPWQERVELDDIVEAEKSNKDVDK
ncbi:MAG: hypothetical protein PHQ00_07770 [Phycisphaerae bacterium]|nr:hypothetical protein [Phycisphaerae bacterium]